jgi:SAM-dependent methyltransferase
VVVLTRDPVDRSSVDRIAAPALAAGDPTGWFEDLYAEAAKGTASVPWGTDVPGATLVDWFSGRPPGTGRALVVGCGYGRDAEFVATRGYDTTGFDIAPTAIDSARVRHADSPVHYEVADLLALPAEWIGAFDLVIESHNVQALPVELHASATAAVSSLVAPGGTLLVLGAVPADGAPPPGPPWPLTRGEVEAFGTALVLDSLETVQLPGMDPARWRAVLRRPA